METISYPLRLPRKLMQLVELRTKEEYVDKSTALRQLVYKGAEDYVIELYKEGHLSLSKAAELLDKSVYDIIQVARRKGLETGATDEQQRVSWETVKRLK